MIAKLSHYYFQMWPIGWWLSLILLLVVRPYPLQASGCTDRYDDNGNSNDNLTTHLVLAAVPAQVDRSLCGFYNADYVEFPAQPGTSYRIQVLNHEDPVSYGVYLELWETPGNGTYNHIATTAAGVVLLDTPTPVTGNLLVRIASTRSDIGSYGGGDYRLSITVNSNAGPTVTATVTPSQTPTATASPPPTATMTATATPTARPATPIPTLTPNQPQRFCLPLIMR